VWSEAGASAAKDGAAVVLEEDDDYAERPTRTAAPSFLPLRSFSRMILSNHNKHTPQPVTRLDPRMYFATSNDTPPLQPLLLAVDCDRRSEMRDARELLTVDLATYDTPR